MLRTTFSCSLYRGIKNGYRRSGKTATEDTFFWRTFLDHFEFNQQVDGEMTLIYCIFKAQKRSLGKVGQIKSVSSLNLFLDSELHHNIQPYRCANQPFHYIGWNSMHANSSNHHMQYIYNHRESLAIFGLTWYMNQKAQVALSFKPLLRGMTTILNHNIAITISKK